MDFGKQGLTACDALRFGVLFIYTVLRGSDQTICNTLQNFDLQRLELQRLDLRRLDLRRLDLRRTGQAIRLHEKASQTST